MRRIGVYLLLVAAAFAAAVAMEDVLPNKDTSDDTGSSMFDSERPYDEMEEPTSLRKDVGCSTDKTCRKKKGTCIPSSETCNGRVVDRGCGTNCTCCVEPKRCKARETCNAAGGYCVKGSGSCTGTTIPDGCTGKNCVCCVSDNNCPHGFYRVGTECFKVYQELAGWDEARQRCRDHGFELAEPENLPALARFIYNDISHFNFWIGARGGCGGSFKYLSGHNLQASIPWAPGYPGTKTDLGHCLVLQSNNRSYTTQVASYDCLGRYYFLCEPACPKGFIRVGSGCFQVAEGSQNWENSERSCYAKGLQIAEPEDPKKLIKMLYDGVFGPRYTRNNFWLGGRGGRGIDNASIVWNSGDPVPNPHPIAGTWYSGKPQHTTSAYCMLLNAYYHERGWGPMYENPCSASVNSICEWGCPIGFFHIGNRCYKAYSNSKVSWAKAREMCIQDGLSLAESENPSIVADYLFTVTGNPNYWLGGRGDGNRVRWLSGEAIPSNAWLPGNPGSKVGSKYCVRMVPEHRITPLTSTTCSTLLYPLCQKYIM